MSVTQSAADALLGSARSVNVDSDSVAAPEGLFVQEGRIVETLEDGLCRQGRTQRKALTLVWSCVCDDDLLSMFLARKLLDGTKVRLSLDVNRRHSTPWRTVHSCVGATLLTKSSQETVAPRATPADEEMSCASALDALRTPSLAGDSIEDPACSDVTIILADEGGRASSFALQALAVGRARDEPGARVHVRT